MMGPISAAFLVLSIRDGLVRFLFESYWETRYIGPCRPSSCTMRGLWHFRSLFFGGPANLRCIRLAPVFPTVLPFVALVVFRCVSANGLSLGVHAMDDGRIVGFENPCPGLVILLNVSYNGAPHRLNLLTSPGK
jgi:hypothetical protein